MGIYPHVRTFRLEHNQSYPSLDEATKELAAQSQAETAEQKAVLQEYLRGAIREEDGTLVMPGSSIRVKMWWEKDQSK